MLLLILISINLKEATAQNVIDNEVLSNNNDTDDNNVNDEDNNKNSNNTNVADDSSNLNEFVSKPLVHVSIEGTEINDKIRGGTGDDTISGGEGNDILQGQEGDDEIDGGEGEDIIDGGAGKDELEGGKGADRFVCDQTDKIIDYNSLENDMIVGKCKYEDKGLVPKPIPDKDPLFSDSQIPVIPENKDLFFEKFISKFNDIDIPNVLD